MRHDIITNGQLEKIKARLGCEEGPIAGLKGKLEARDMMDHRGSEVRVEGIASMNHKVDHTIQR